MKLSAIILTKNEEAMLADCIDSVSFCDEIVVIDSGSTDRTVEIAKHLGAKVYTCQETTFAARRNMGKEKAKGDWLFYIDADERVTPELRKNIQQVIVSGTASDGYRVERRNFYLGKNEWPYRERLERLFKRNSLQEWKGNLHETAVVKGSMGDVEGLLDHYTHRDLTSMLQKTIAWSQMEAELRLKANHPKMTWWRFPRVMLTAFWDSYVRQQGYKAGIVGIIESMYQMFSMFITYARLWEMQQKGERKA